VALAVALDIEKRIGNAERQLVPELRRADGVGVDQDVRHGIGMVNA
jgi:hypothetical protein